MDQQNPAQAPQPVAPAPEQPVPPVAPAPADPASVPPSIPPAPTSPVGSPAAAPIASGTPASQTPAKKSSSKMIIILLVLLLVLAGGGFAAYQFFMPKSNTMEKGAAVQVSPTTAPEPTEGPVKSGDTQIDQQSDAIDTSMEKLNDDAKNVESGLGDQADSLQ